MTIERLQRLRRSVIDQRATMGTGGNISPRLLRYIMTRLRIILLSSPDARRDIIELLNEMDKITLATMQLRINTE